MELCLTVPGDQSKAKTEALQFSDKVFAHDFKEGLIHQVVTAYLAGARAGTKAQKTRAEVRGGGAKPFRQKGTGRARAGTIRSPIWRKGGIIFAAKPRDFSQKVNRKMYRSAMRSILSELIRKERLKVIEDITVESHKTKQLAAKLKEFNLNNVLIISDSLDKNIYLAARNISDVTVIDTAAVNPVLLIRHQNVLITVAAMKKLEEWLG